MSKPPRFSPVDGKRRCSKCGDEKPWTAEHFMMTRGRVGGLCIACSRASARRSQRRPEARARDLAFKASDLGKQKARRRAFVRLYGLTHDELHQMFENQEGLCLVCSQPICLCEQVRCNTRAHVDHDHATGKVRGLLCRGCNMGIGHLADSPVRLKNAARYLEAS